jgi:hypothetical protein
MHATPALDFRYGWRWLLPLSGARGVVTVGLPELDAMFLLQELGIPGAEGPGGGDALWVVNADDPAARDGARLIAKGHPASFCVVGSGGAARRWAQLLAGSCPYVREYALLPASAPRVVVPLANATHARVALRLHRPGRRVARWALAIAARLLSAGIRAPLRRKVLWIGSRDPDALPVGVAISGLEPKRLGARPDFALYLGTPESTRKTVVLPLGNRPADVIVKLAQTDDAKLALLREIAALRALAETEVANRVPRCIRVHEREGALALHQEYRPRRTSRASQIEHETTSFLAELARLGRFQAPLSAEMDRLDGAPNLRAGPPGRVFEALRTLAAAGATVWKHQTHGDLAPWNCAWTETGLFVYDWEEARADGLAFSDAFYYCIGPAKHIGSGTPTGDVVRSALGLAGRVATLAKLEDVDLVVHLALWALWRYHRVPEPFYESLLEAVERAWTPRHG